MLLLRAAIASPGPPTSAGQMRETTYSRKTRLWRLFQYSVNGDFHRRGDGDRVFLSCPELVKVRRSGVKNFIPLRVVGRRDGVRHEIQYHFRIVFVLHESSRREWP